MSRSPKGFYHDTNGNIFFFGHRKAVDPAGATWVEIQSRGDQEKTLINENALEDLTWNGSQVILAFDPFERKKEDKIAEIKNEAQRRIFEIAPEWKQRNLTARAVELINLGQNSTQEFSDIQAVWDSVKAIRDTSDQLEADVNAAATDAEVDAVGWPSS